VPVYIGAVLGRENGTCVFASPPVVPAGARRRVSGTVPGRLRERRRTAAGPVEWCAPALDEHPDDGGAV